MDGEVVQSVKVLVKEATFVVVEKRGGIPVQPDPTGDLDLLSMLQAQLNDTAIGLVHRLDRPVSGAMIYARTEAALADLNKQFKERTVKKVYWAIVEGAFPNSKVLEHSLVHDARYKKARISASGSEDDVNARLTVNPLAVGDRYSLVEVLPDGGAFHQIRAQLAAAGHAVKGDVKYGARRGEKDRTISLHSRSIDFDHPVTHIRMSYTAGTPAGGIWAALEAKVPLGR